MNIKHWNVYDKDFQLTLWGRILSWMDLKLGGFLVWRALMQRISFQTYCGRCTGCGYVECCGLKCDKGFGCAGFYGDRECINTASPLMYVLDDMNEQAIFENEEARNQVDGSVHDVEH